MIKCKHECEECGETWECSYPYYSDFHYFANVVNNGSYCNAYCPSCKKEEREDIDNMFENLPYTGYLNSFNKRITENT